MADQVAYVNEEKKLNILEQLKNDVLFQVKHQQRIIKLIDFLESNSNVVTFLDENNAGIYIR